MGSAAPAVGTLRCFVDGLAHEGIVGALRAGLIGEGVEIDGPFGPKSLVYADYTASGRALTQVERFIVERVLPFYSNSHTEASYCGAYMNKLRGEARNEIARVCHADFRHAVIFAGSGATAGVNRLVKLLIGEAPVDRPPPLVLLGPYEHHSNILPWRESGAEVVEIGVDDEGSIELSELEVALTSAAAGAPRLVIGTFSAASNVTGVISDVTSVNALLKSHGAITVWDYAGGGPYLPIDMNVGGGIDAVVLSPHKFVGGPGASGLLIIRKDAVRATRPTQPGGGTVLFVSPWSHRYAEALTTREEPGTPNILGDLRAALALMIKESVGQTFILERCQALRKLALAAWSRVEELEVLGPNTDKRLPIFSFRVRDRDGGYIHHQLVTRLLSDCHGVQARGGCACAGPYAHRLLGLDRAQSDALQTAIMSGDEIQKPGWTRLNLSYLMDEAKIDHVINAVISVARNAGELQSRYAADRSTARYRAVAASA